MQLLREEYARRGGTERAHYLSSHPPPQERIDTARDAAQR
jgi:predicted Zn-dependent protease